MKRIVSILLIIFLIIPNIAMAQAVAKEELGPDLKFFEEVLRYIEKKHPFEVEESSLIKGGLKGMLQSLDPYSDYYGPEEAKEVYESMSGEFSGIGLYIEEKDGYISIQNTIKGQPAEKAGLKAGDLIISVEKKDIKGLGIRKISSMIKGPVGTKVLIGVKRGEDLLSFQVTRDRISINPIDYKILDKEIGYIELREFTGQATGEMKKALKEFDGKKVKKVILDLRNNPGGLLSEAISISRLFVPRGPIVHIREKGKQMVTYVSTLEKSKYELVVLVNENSASASEILAGAVKDRKAGKLVGSKTYGKGLVQSMIPFPDGSIVKLTIAEYLTPDKISINGEGIEVDYKVENTLEEDLQLKKAIEILK